MAVLDEALHIGEQRRVRRRRAVEKVLRFVDAQPATLPPSLRNPRTRMSKLI